MRRHLGSFLRLRLSAPFFFFAAFRRMLQVEGQDNQRGTLHHDNNRTGHREHPRPSAIRSPRNPREVVVGREPDVIDFSALPQAP